MNRNSGTIEQLICNYKPIDKSINVFMIGSRGFTKNYGGWEAFARGLLNNWIDSSVQWFVFEIVEDENCEGIIDVNGIIVIRVFEGSFNSSSMPKFDVHCTKLACLMVRKHGLSNPIMFHLGVRIGPFLWINKAKYKNSGFTMMYNPAGVEWRRKKWGKFLQLYLYISARLMAVSEDYMICDNEGIKELYDSILKRKKPVIKYIGYGVDRVDRIFEPMPNNVKDLFCKWGIRKDGYYLILGRFVPENNYEMMLNGFINSNSNRKLLVITNYQTEIKRFYNHIKKTTGYENDNRIIMAGTLYDKETLHYIRQNAHGYIHGHSVGGTNPGLLEAMEETDVNMLYNVSFNKYVGKESALYFSNQNELSLLIDKVDHMTSDEIESLGISARKNMSDNYSWKHIVNQYDSVILSICNFNNS